MGRLEIQLNLTIETTCILQIVARYDVILIQEVRDSTETAVNALVSEVNKISK